MPPAHLRRDGSWHSSLIQSRLGSLLDGDLLDLNPLLWLIAFSHLSLGNLIDRLEPFGNFRDRDMLAIQRGIIFRDEYGRTLRQWTVAVNLSSPLKPSRRG